MSRFAWILGLATVLCAALPARGEGEVLHLRGGQRLEGVSRGLEDGVLRWELPDGGEMRIALDLVERIEFPQDVGIDVGPVLDPVDDEPDGSAAASSAAFGRACELALTEASTWTKRLEFGGQVLSGNVRNESFNANVQLERKEETWFTQIDAGGQSVRADGRANVNRWFLNGTADFNIDDHWIYFGISRNEYDSRENLDYRGTLSAGLGYRFVNEPKRRLILRAGPGVTHERFSTPGNHRTTPDFLGEVDFRWPVFTRTQLEHKTTVNPSLDNLNVFRLNSVYNVLFQLDEQERWMLKFGFRHDYNSQPNPGRVPSDYTTMLQLVYIRK